VPVRSAAGLEGALPDVDRVIVDLTARAYDGIVHGESAYFVWLNYGKEGFSRLRSHMRWRFVRRTQPHGLLVYSPFATKGIPDKSSDPAGQATPPTPVLLYDSSHRQALATAGGFRLPEEARMLPDRRAGPHPSRAPPADLVN
jgi:hypothetical protein